ncbi:MAG: glycosyltransferase family 2 protein [Vulcanimicrobiaceae bacterium]
MKLSVVIATKDRAGFLAAALASLATQRNAPPFEAIVVDNGSRDGTAPLVRERARDGGFPLHYVYAGEPNRGAARNAGVARATGDIVAFVDDDVVLPEHFLFAHAAAHARRRGAAVTGPILNVPAPAARARPGIANYSGAFFCTCNVSVARDALEAVGGFDERFKLYGWEDTELGLRLRRSGVRRAFAWDAYLWHIKPHAVETLDVVVRKTLERAQMAGLLLRKDGSLRTRLATGAYGLNLARSTALAPPWSLRWYGALAANDRVPAPLRAIARAQLLDGSYTRELRAALAANARTER